MIKVTAKGGHYNSEPRLKLSILNLIQNPTRVLDRDTPASDQYIFRASCIRQYLLSPLELNLISTH